MNCWKFCILLSTDDLMFFFFQAEDGIRDHCVTGVQTCALPIYVEGGIYCDDIAQCIEVSKMRPEEGGLFLLRWANIIAIDAPLDIAPVADRIKRSEERRVGKECRSRWSPYH